MDRKRRGRIWPSCYVWHTVPAKTIAELQRLPKIHMGRTNPGTSSDTQQRVLRKLFKVNVHSVAGYAGSAEAFIAVERGELEGGCMTWASLPPHWIADNKITPIMRVTSATAPDLPASVPSASDLLPQDRDRKILRVLSAAGEVGKPFVAQVSVPDERVAILRQAFAAMVQDSGFAADAAKLRQPVSPDARAPSDENPRRDLRHTGRHRRRGARDRERLTGPQRPRSWDRSGARYAFRNSGQKSSNDARPGSALRIARICAALPLSITIAAQS